ncbi:hypothetical protein MVEN_02114800 [Mycena venus]|uniref:Uncharacterized protein n=1 Tax=Mycena venus TaxID=2733690 RepID=A0A8H6X9Q8_9AGAR|nr:hypothetical protein MVEN_02114800 [Mycena venus]
MSRVERAFNPRRRKEDASTPPRQIHRLSTDRFRHDENAGAGTEQTELPPLSKPLLAVAGLVIDNHSAGSD